VREFVGLFLGPQRGAHVGPGLAVAQFDGTHSHSRPRLLKLSTPLRPMIR
jgi:hypothetical protein